MPKVTIANAAGWTTLGAVAGQVIGFLVSIVLARLLLPADFGVLAMVTAVTGFAKLLADMGLSSALIQHKEPSEEQYASVFWANIAIGLLLAAVLAGLGPLAPRFYGDPRVAPVTVVLAGQFVVAALGSVHAVRMQKRMAFKQLVALELGAALLSGVVGAAAALAGAGVWSLVAKSHAQTASFVLGIWLVERWFPRRRPSLAGLRELLRFSVGLTGSRALNYWTRNLDNVLIGKYFGAADVGLYVRGYSVLMQPVSLIATALGRVMFPALSAAQDDLERVRAMYKRAVRVIAFVCFPAMALLFVSAREFVLVLFGESWLGTVPVLKIFCAGGALQSLGATAGWIFQSRGRTDLQFIWSIVAGVFMMLSIAAGIALGSIESVALCYTVVSGGVLLVPAFEVPGRLIGIGFLSVAAEVVGPLVITLLAASAAWAASLLVPAPAVARLALVWMVGGALYLALARLTRQRALLDLSERLLPFLRRSR